MMDDPIAKARAIFREELRKANIDAGFYEDRIRLLRPLEDGEVLIEEVCLNCAQLRAIADAIDKARGIGPE
jgi:hypothetical protein